MGMTDPFSDMLTRIRNAGKAKFNSVDIPGSKMKIEFAKLLKTEGYIKGYKIVEDNKQGILRVYLKYSNLQKHVIYGIEIVSKRGRRLYIKCKDIKPVLNGMGISVLTTSKGIITDKQAIQLNIGGEVLCKVW